MNSKKLFDKVSNKCSRITTHSYSTSFSLGIKMLDYSIREAIYAIYGFVRFADEIVDTLEGFDQKKLLEEFKHQTFQSIESEISLNPILNSFQKSVNKYKINYELIECFFESMEMDLVEKNYNQTTYEKYILGSAQVVGLMCLKVFCSGNEEQYEQLKPGAMRLGSAFQKVNFLRDLKADQEQLGRMYFPDLTGNKLNLQNKKTIEKEIQEDFDIAFKSIKKLPKNAKFGVYTAYIYYLGLFKKIQNVPPKILFERRIRISNFRKFLLLCSCKFKVSFQLI